FLTEQSQDRERERLDTAHVAGAVAARARGLRRLLERRPQALARQLEQAEARDAADLDARSVVLDRVAQLVLDLALRALRAHVDEVDDDETAQVANPELPADFLGGLEVRVERRLLDVLALRRAGRVDVDGRQRLGVVDDDAAARRQRDLMAVGRLDLALDLEAREERYGLVLVELELAQVVRQHALHELERLLIDGRVVDQDFADVVREVVAQRAHDRVAFLVDQERGRARDDDFLDGLPDAQQVVEVPAQLLGVTADAGRAHDAAH